ncbi:MAG: hypothetical protein ACR2NO_12360 [Chloroflexota bacterium]
MRAALRTASPEPQSWLTPEDAAGQSEWIRADAKRTGLEYYDVVK